ncbi:ATP-binding protein [Myxococcota bacterium]|nr:ATP-binding protein [Myxococcota bacterium]
MGSAEILVFLEARTAAEHRDHTSDTPLLNVRRSKPKNASRHRPALTAGLLLLPVVIVLAAAGSHLLKIESRAQTNCWILPNTRVLQTPATPNCPLEGGDLVRRVELPDANLQVHDLSSLDKAIGRSTEPQVRILVHRNGSTLWKEVPVSRSPNSAKAIRIAVAIVMSGFLLGIPLYLLWHATPNVAIPLAIFYSSISTIVVTSLIGQHSQHATRLALVALSFVPAALTHLAFTFPRERSISKHIPSLKYTPYGVSLLLVIVGFFALERAPILWQPFSLALGGLTIAAWLVLMIACAHSLSRSCSPIERAQARLVFIGSLLLPLGPMLFWATMTSTTTDLVFLYLWTIPIVMPLPIGVAISRYNLFDLGWDIRFWVGRLLLLGLSALIMTLVLHGVLAVLHTPTSLHAIEPLFLVSLLCAAVAEAFREKLTGLMENTAIPRLQKLRATRETFEQQVSTVRDEETITHHLVDSLANSLGARSGALFLENSTCSRLARVFGNTPPTSTKLLLAARETLDTDPIVHLSASEASSPEISALRTQGVECIAAVESSGQRFGVLLVGSSPGRWPYTGVEIDFISALTRQAGLALRNSQITRDLLAQEHHATTGRAAIGVAHEVGKELAWIRRLARRVGDPDESHDRRVRDASLLVEMTESASAALCRLVDYATRGTPEQSTNLTLDSLVERAVRQVFREHGSERVSQVITSSARQALCDDNLGRALFNLLDNATHASPASEPVRLFVTCENSWLSVEIEDRGSGIPETDRSRVFDPGYSTRLGSGGSGLGLGVAREIIETLGGSLELSPILPRGTRARFKIPITN